MGARACDQQPLLKGGVVEARRGEGEEVSLSSVCVPFFESPAHVRNVRVPRARLTHVSRTACARFIFNPAGVGRSWLSVGRRLGPRSLVPCEQEPAGPLGL